MFNGFKGAAKRLDKTDWPEIAAQIGVGEDELHAFAEVEASGSGFDAKGRVKMLFEPHVFHRELGPGKSRTAAIKAGLAYPKWKPGGYPADSYPRLMKAMAIDETAALRSASWGLGQIMGNNCRAAGYATPQKMIEAFAADEEAQLQAIVDFLKAKGLDKALRAHDWKTLEKGYNGGGFNGAYATKLAAAFAKWQKMKDTPSVGVTIAEVTAVPAAPAADETSAVHIEPVSAAPDDRLVIKRKPILRSRKVWSTINGYVTGGFTGFVGAFAGFEWRTALIIVGGILFIGLVFLLLYRHEIRAGMFAPEERK